jgi:hypothetical protein
MALRIIVPTRAGRRIARESGRSAIPKSRVRTPTATTGTDTLQRSGWRTLLLDRARSAATVEYITTTAAACWLLFLEFPVISVARPRIG